MLPAPQCSYKLLAQRRTSCLINIWYSPLKLGTAIMAKLQAVILAAGQSKRFRTGNTKLLEKVCGQEIILYPTNLLSSMEIPTTIVVGHQAERIEKTVQAHHRNTVDFAEQGKRHSRGHALLCSKSKWHAQDILVMNGDTPFVSEEIITSLQLKHKKNDAVISIVKSHCCESASASYDHIIRNDDGQIEVVSMHECSASFQESCCVDAGIYMIDGEFLHECATRISGEETRFHIGDLVREANRNGHTVEMVSAPFDRIRSIDTFQDLWCAQQVKRAELMKYWMNRGVHFFTAQNVHLDLDVKIGVGTFIGCGVQLFGKTHIGSNAHIGHFSVIEESTIGSHATIQPHSVLTKTTIAEQENIGPFAHITNKKKENCRTQKNKQTARRPAGATRLQEFC